MCAQTGKPSFLYGQSYLQNLGIELKFLDELENLFIRRSKEKIHVRRDYRVQTECIIDISEKIGFLYLALDYVKQLDSEILIKYHFYNFVYDCKACLDSIAVLLNHQLNLGFKGGERDFRHGKFCRALETRSTYLKDFSSKFGSWCNAIIEFRKRIIHQIGVFVFQQAALGGSPPTEEVLMRKPFLPYCVPRRAISLIERVYGGKTVESVEIVTFCQDNIKKIMDITEIALSEVYDSIGARI